MRNKSKTKYKVIWTCDYCGEEFKTKKESDQHEVTCKKNPKNNEIVFKIKKPNNSTIFGWASLFIFIYFIVYIVANANAQNNGLSIRDLLKPQGWFTPENEIVVPTITPTSIPTSIPTQKVVDTDPIIDCKSDYPNCKGSSIKVRSSQCSKITCCGFNDGKWIIYPSVEKCKEAQNKGQPTQVNNPTIKPNNTGISVEEYNKQLAAIKIDCSFNSPPYSFNFGQLTSTECKQKTDAYWAERKAAIPTNISYPTTAPTSAPIKSQADIDKCKSEVREKYTNLINGCYIQYQGSASDACARGYQNLSSSEMSACY